MIDQEYFTSVFRTQTALIGGKASAEIVLHSGTRYHVHEVKSAQPGYACIQVFPPEGHEIEVQEDLEDELRAGRSGFNTAEVAISYEAIEHVYISRSADNRKRSIGFKPSR